MLAVTLGGIFIVATLIGVMTTGIEGKLDELRKGRSLVIEADHTVILGWSPQIFDDHRRARRSRTPTSAKPRIVVLADRDKVEMEDEIRSAVANTLATRAIVCRTRQPDRPRRPGDRQARTSPSIIVLAPEADDPGHGRHQDAAGDHQRPERRPEPYHIVAEIRDASEHRVARLAGARRGAAGRSAAT